MNDKERDISNIFSGLSADQRKYNFGTTGGASVGASVWITTSEGNSIQAVAMEALPPGRAVVFKNGDRWEAYSPHTNEEKRTNVYHQWRLRGDDPQSYDFIAIYTIDGKPDKVFVGGDGPRREYSVAGLERVTLLTASFLTNNSWIVDAVTGNFYQEYPVPATVLAIENGTTKKIRTLQSQFAVTTAQSLYPHGSGVFITPYSWNEIGGLDASIQSDIVYGLNYDTAPSGLFTSDGGNYSEFIWSRYLLPTIIRLNVLTDSTNNPESNTAILSSAFMIDSLRTSTLYDYTNQIGGNGIGGPQLLSPLGDSVVLDLPSYTFNTTSPLQVGNVSYVEISNPGFEPYLNDTPMAVIEEIEPGRYLKGVGIATASGTITIDHVFEVAYDYYANIILTGSEHPSVTGRAYSITGSYRELYDRLQSLPADVTWVGDRILIANSNLTKLGDLTRDSINYAEEFIIDRESSPIRILKQDKPIKGRMAKLLNAGETIDKIAIAISPRARQR